MQQLNQIDYQQSCQKLPSSTTNNRVGNKANGRWTKEEHLLFVEALKKFGKNWKLVEEYVGTRSGAQIRSHAQKFFNRVERDFNLKPESPTVQSRKRKTKENLQSTSQSSPLTTVSYDNPLTLTETTPSDKNLKDLSSMLGLSNAISQASTPNLNRFENPVSGKTAAEDTIQSLSFSLFDVLRSNMKNFEKITISPRLSDLVEVSSSTRSSFNEISPKINCLSWNSSFRLHSRKTSNDDDELLNKKLSQLRRPENSKLDSLEVMTKKVKTD